MISFDGEDSVSDSATASVLGTETIENTLSSSQDLLSVPPPTVVECDDTEIDSSLSDTPASAVFSQDREEECMFCFCAPCVTTSLPTSAIPELERNYTENSGL